MTRRAPDRDPLTDVTRVLVDGSNLLHALANRTAGPTSAQPGSGPAAAAERADRPAAGRHPRRGHDRARLRRPRGTRPARRTDRPRRERSLQRAIHGRHDPDHARRGGGGEGRRDARPRVAGGGCPARRHGRSRPAWRRQPPRGAGAPARSGCCAGWSGRASPRPSVGNARPPKIDQGPPGRSVDRDGDGERAGWSPGRGATRKRGNGRPAPKSKRPPNG